MPLRYRTNGPKFDFPVFDGLPPVRYVLASTPRSGSNMLARALWHSGAAGFAEDYFADAHVLDYFERWGFAADDPDGLPAGYIRQLMRWRTSPNGAFGVKVHAGHLASLEVDLHELMLSPRYVWIQRRDRLRQAVSYLRAEQTGVWIVDGTYLPTGRQMSSPRYDRDEIQRRLAMLEHDDRTWSDYFARRGLEPHVVVYEDLLADYETTVRRCLAFLGVEAPGRIPAPSIERQSDEATERWVERFVKEH